MGIINQLRNAAKKAGLTIEDKGKGHFQITGGALLVNYYPTSKKQTAYVDGTRGAMFHVNPQEAVALANKPPEKNGTIKKCRKKKEGQTERTNLRQENKRHKEENEIIKKADVFFAK